MKKIEVLKEYAGWAIEHKYVVSAVGFAVVAAVAVFTGHLFTGILSAAGAGLSVTAMAGDGMNMENDDDYNSHQ